MASKSKRIAVVTGGNKGVGLEICRQLAGEEVMVVLTARDKKRGVDAVAKLRSSGSPDIVFHELDVTDPASIASLAEFIDAKFGKLDILVNNAGVSSTFVDKELFWSLNLPSEVIDEKAKKSKVVVTQTYEGARKCLETNYYGAKHVTQALLTLLLKSSSPRIVNVSSKLGQLENVQDENARKILSDFDGLTEELVDGVVSEYLNNAKDQESLEKKGWSSNVSGYVVSKAALNAYTRIVAKKYPSLCANAVSPGFVATDMTFFQGTSTAEEGARGPVRLALMPHGGPSGQSKVIMASTTEKTSTEKRVAVVTGGNKGIGLEICRQLALNNITVILTARNESRGVDAVAKLNVSGPIDVVFHQLDVKDPTSIARLAKFVESQFKKLDILVNNAGENGIIVNYDEFRAFKDGAGYMEVYDENAHLLNGIIEQPYNLGEECIKTNYYGAKAVTEAFLPLLELSSFSENRERFFKLRRAASKQFMTFSKTKRGLDLRNTKKNFYLWIHNEKVKAEFLDIDNLTEEKIDGIIQRFLTDFKANKLSENGWPLTVGAYKVSKAAMNGYTRLLARKFPNILVNCVHPGYVITDITSDTGHITPEEGARAPVMLALLPNDGPSGSVHNGVVTGGNKGIGLEICRQLALNGIEVILTARSESRGLEAVAKLNSCGLSDVVFHQLDIKDPTSITCLAKFIETRFKKLDILINNAAEMGIVIHDKEFRSGGGFVQVTDENVDSLTNVVEEPYELGEQCLNTNYYATKNVTETLIPLLQRSESPRLVNITSIYGNLHWFSNEKLKEELEDIENLTEARIDEIIQWFLRDFKDAKLKENGWPLTSSAYKVSKAALNAYTRLMAKKFQNIHVNCVHPGYCETDMTSHTGFQSAEEGAKGPVMVALLPNDGPSVQFSLLCAVVTGSYKGIGLEICRQLALNGVQVVLTARNETRGVESLEKLKESGISDVVFHQLDIKDPTSVARLAKFVETHFKKLDILVNNAAETGIIYLNENKFKDGGAFVQVLDENVHLLTGVIEQTYELAEECLKTNYYGTKRITEALIPLLQLSSSPRIVNVTSAYGDLHWFYNEKLKEELADIENMTEERIDEIIQWFLMDFKADKLQENGWPLTVSAYKVSKVVLNAYTRLMARKFPNILVNCVHPGYCVTDMTINTGFSTAEEGAKGPVMAALLPNDGPSGVYFNQMEMIPFTSEKRPIY
ncbi:hypothetical protein OSB04_022507 [Centaurea solstitialis]|uniref:Glucose/ribitol dehydrogenase n=1 Tax=Centaurea solstitialis TaxID=347529 RepID=A0AA38WHC0_9ASTR|nr:hypothetical protein OSB04_022507 [Centaurea solstitialis]